MSFSLSYQKILTFTEMGTQTGQPFSLRKRIILVNRICLLSLLICVLIFPIQLSMGNSTAYFSIINLFIYGGVLLLHKKNRINLGRTVFSLWNTILVSLLIPLLGNTDSSLSATLLLLIVGQALIFETKEKLSLFGCTFFAILAQVALRLGWITALEKFFISIPTEGDHITSQIVSLATVIIFILILLSLTIENEEYETALEDAKNKAEANLLERSNFLAMVSHEIKTPLNGVIALLDLMNEETLSQKGQDNLGVIKSSADSLQAILNDILDFSRIESSRLRFDVTDFNLEAVINNLFKSLKIRTEKRKIVLRSELPDGLPPFLSGDSNRLRQILLNLIDNALKFTPHGEIILRVKIIDQTETSLVLRCEVEDTGIGIPEEKLHTIFDQFAQVSSKKSLKFEGTGLGTFICKNLVEQQGGKIWVESEQGKGSIFSFELPFNIPVSTGHKLSSTLTNGVTDFNGLKTLLVEDNDVNQYVLKRILESLNIGYEACDNGIEAIEKIKHGKFDLIMADYFMPEMDGLELIETVRKDMDLTIPIFLVTADSTRQTHQAAINKGANGIILKPLTPEKISQKLSPLFNCQRFHSRENVTRTSKTEDSFVQIDFLKQILGDDPEIIGELLEKTLSNSTSLIKGFKEAILTEDRETMKRNAHTLKSNFRNLGTTVAAELLQKVETKMTEEHISAAIADFEEFESLYPKIYQECQNLKSELLKEVD